jgi:hypothetical protein
MRYSASLVNRLMTALTAALRASLALSKATRSKTTATRRKARRFERAYTTARDSGICLQCGHALTLHFRNGRKLDCHQVR